MALKQNNGGSDDVQSAKQPLAPKLNTTGAQSTEYSLMVRTLIQSDRA